MDDELFVKAATAEGETADLDFKKTFDPNSTGDWCELVKDIVAFANSGGGCIAFGVEDGSLAEVDLDRVRSLDQRLLLTKCASTLASTLPVSASERSSVMAGRS